MLGSRVVLGKREPEKYLLAEEDVLSFIGRRDLGISCQKSLTKIDTFPTVDNDGKVQPEKWSV